MQLSRRQREGSKDDECNSNRAQQKRDNSQFIIIRPSIFSFLDNNGDDEDDDTSLCLILFARTEYINAADLLKRKASDDLMT